MVQVIQSNRQKGPSFFESLMYGLGQGAVQGGQAYLQKKQQNQLVQDENQAASRMGVDLAGFSDPKLRHEVVSQELRGQNQKTKDRAGQLEDIKSYGIIKNRFGEDAANLWISAPVGGKTKFLQKLLENEERGNSLQSQFGQPEQQPQEQSNNQSLFEVGEEDSPVGEPIKAPRKVIDYDKGLTPKERVKRQDDRYAKALPLIDASQTKVHAYGTIGEELETLKQLSPQIGGWERLNINPMTGDLIIPGLASPEAQQFVKTINDFTIQAKDSYGSRVTNFDLNQFMRRLPTLANSAEGRERILEQMTIINDLNKMYEQSLHDVIEEHGGIRNIDFDRAKDLAYKEFEKNNKSLKSQLKELSSADKRDFKHQVEEKKRKAPSGQVLMMTSSGEFGYVPQSEVDKALKDGLTLP